MVGYVLVKFGRCRRDWQLPSEDYVGVPDGTKPQIDQAGWYDLIVKVSGDASFRYQLAGHVETGKESISDPALGGLVTLQG
jgi:hypothetical protein